MAARGSTPEITFLSTYDCLGCGAPLVARADQLGGWLRCPDCGRPGLPPEFDEAPRPVPRGTVVAGNMDDDTLVIGPLFDPPAPPESAAGRGRARRFSPFRVLMLLVVAIAVAWLIEAFLTRSVPAAVIATVVGAGALYAMTRRDPR